MNDMQECDENDDELLQAAREAEQMERFYARVRSRQERLEQTRKRYAPHTGSAFRNLIWLGFAFLVIGVLIVISYFFW